MLEVNSDHTHLDNGVVNKISDLPQQLLKHEEQNSLVERHSGIIVKLVNTMLIHARLSKKFFH